MSIELALTEVLKLVSTCQIVPTGLQPQSGSFSGVGDPAEILEAALVGNIRLRVGLVCFSSRNRADISMACANCN